MNFRFLFALLAVLFSLSDVQAVIITSYLQAYDSPGNTFQVQGSGFLGGTNVVRFTGTAGTAGTYYAPYTFISSDTILYVKVPANAPIGGLFNLAVRKGSGGDFTQCAQEFRVISTGPYVDHIDPMTGDAGTLVSIHGVNLVGTSSANQIKVWFNGVQAPTYAGQSDMLLRYYAPAGVTTGPVTVTRTTGPSNTPAPTNISTAIFYVTPAVTNFSPSAGRAGTNVIIRGRNFSGATGVYFNGLSAQFTSDSPTQVTAVVPPGATTGKIHVQTLASGYLPSTSNFVVQPLITGFSPNKGQAGTVVTILGAHLWGATNVLFGGVPATPSGVSYGQLAATVPNGAPTGPITVQTTNGTFISTELFYLAPRIDSFAPTNGPAGSLVYIKGTNFLDASSVTFNGTPAADFWVTNNGSIGAQVPEGVVTGPIFVTTPHSTTNSLDLLFYAVPIITGFNPNHGLPGTNVTILGANFAGTTAVKFNGTNAAFTETNGTLTAIVPTNAVTGPVSVTGPAGTTVSAAVFTLDYTSDLAVLVSAPASFELGTGDFTYVITVTNRGPFAAPNVVLTNLLPGSVVLKSAAVPPPGSLVLGANPVTGSLGTLNARSKITVTLTVTPLSTGVIANNTVVSGGYPDPSPANNVSVTNTTVFVTPVLGVERLSETQLRLSWALTLSEYYLQSTSDLALSNSWADVLTEPEFIGNNKVVTETIGAGPRFYRLKR